MKKNLLIRPLILLSLLLFFSLLIFTNSFSHVRASLTDNLQGQKNPLDNIVIIGIDDQSINEIGRWPWERDVFAEILLAVRDAKVIGVDLSFFEPSKDDVLLNSTLSSRDNVVLAAEVNKETLYKPIFDSDFGYVNLVTDNDGVVRSIRTNLKQGVKPFSYKIYEKAWPSPAEISQDVYNLNFFGGAGSFNEISARDLLSNPGKYDFNGKFVLIGATAPDLHDTFVVPTSDGIEMPGVEIQATIVQNFILNSFVRKQSNLFIFFLVLFSGILGVFFLSRLNIYYTIPLVIGIIILYSILGILLFNNSNLLLDFFFVPISLIVFTGTGIGINYIEEKKRSAYISDAFGKYVNKSLLNKIMETKTLNLGGEKKNITIFFSDIRGFTNLSEKLSPEELGDLINNYLTEMTKIILKNKGTIDKFIGDAIMAFWNAPLEEKQHAELACAAAIEQIKALREFNKSLKGKVNELKIGCGIHTGDAIVGNFGSNDRFDYTAIGDSVNLASRLEGLTKHYGASIIISESTHEAIKNKFPSRRIDLVRVKGKRKPVTIYELCTQENKPFIKQFEKALDLYLKSRFKESKKEFDKALKMKKTDKPSSIFLERCKQFIKKNPGKNWDGVFEMETK